MTHKLIHRRSSTIIFRLNFKRGSMIRGELGFAVCRYYDLPSHVVDERLHIRVSHEFTLDVTESVYWAVALRRNQGS